LRRFVASAVIVLVLDQATKWWVNGALGFGESVRLIGDLVRLVHVRNAGSAFGLIQGSRPFFIVLSLASIAAILVLILSGRFHFRGSWVAFGVVLGGAIGNLIDRFWLHHVVDFIDIGFGSVRWPTFNVADIALTLGVLYLAVRFAWPQGAETRPPSGAGEPG